MQEPELQADSPEKQALRAYNAAVRLLGSRDHSVMELTRKLTQREHTAEAINSALDELKSANYVNDARYAQLYAEQRVERGYGPRYIKAKLQERGIETGHIDTAINQQNLEWFEFAQNTLEKRFDNNAITSTDNRVVGKIARFLDARGFARADALKALHSSRKKLGTRNK